MDTVKYTTEIQIMQSKGLKCLQKSNSRTISRCYRLASHSCFTWQASGFTRPTGVGRSPRSLWRIKVTSGMLCGRERPTFKRRPASLSQILRYLSQVVAHSWQAPCNIFTHLLFDEALTSLQAATQFRIRNTLGSFLWNLYQRFSWEYHSTPVVIFT